MQCRHIGCLLQFTLFFEIGSFTDLVRLAGQEMPEVSVSDTPVWGLQVHVSMSGFYKGAGKPNSGLQVCMANTLSSLQFPNVFKKFFFVIHKSNKVINSAPYYNTPTFRMSVQYSLTSKGDSTAAKGLDMLILGKSSSSMLPSQSHMLVLMLYSTACPSLTAESQSSGRHLGLTCLRSACSGGGGGRAQSR